MTLDKSDKSPTQLSLYTPQSRSKNVPQATNWSPFRHRHRLPFSTAHPLPSLKPSFFFLLSSFFRECDSALYFFLFWLGFRLQAITKAAYLTGLGGFGHGKRSNHGN
jgi:hypothetical protein